MEQIRVVVADDHPGVRSGIRYLLERAADIEVIGEANNGVDALELARKFAPDVLLLDIELPEMSGIEVAQELQSRGTPVRILALSSYTDQGYILGMLSSGVAGYLIKEEAPEILVEAVRGIMEGEEGWFSPQVVEQIPKALQPKHKHLH